MTKLSTLVVSISALVTFAACGVETGLESNQGDDGADVIRIADWNGGHDLVDVAPPANLDYIELLASDLGGQQDGICACDSDACVKEYILQNLGCGICVDAVCDGHFTGGCYSCPEGDGALANLANAPVAATVNDTLVR